MNNKKFVPIFSEIEGPLFRGALLAIKYDENFFRYATATVECGYFIAGVYPYAGGMSVGSLVRVKNLETILLDGVLKEYVRKE